MKMKISHLLTAVLSLLAISEPATTAKAQTAARITYSADVTDRRTHQTAHQIFSMNPDGSDPKQLTIGGGAFPAWSQGQTKILFHRSTPFESTLYVMDSSGEVAGGRIFP